MGSVGGQLSSTMPIALHRCWSVATLSFAVATASCTTATDAGSGLYAHIGILPSMSQEAVGVYSGIDDFGFQVTAMRVVLTRENGTFLYDSTIAISPGQDSLVLELLVPLQDAKELVDARVELRDTAVTLFSGSERVELRKGGANVVSPVIMLDYTGPGALAQMIDMSPRDTTIAPKSQIIFTAAARDAYGVALRNVPVSWTLSDPTTGQIDASGNFVPRGRGETWVIARLPTGLRDSAKVVVAR
jgi:hypothetical protein